MRSVLIVIPTWNEELVIRENSEILLRFCDEYLSGYDWHVLIADNASRDRTMEECGKVSHPRFGAFHTDQQGRGHALVTAWTEHAGRADYVVYMDSDLSVGLEALVAMLKRLDVGDDIVVGSRFVNGANVDRSLKRETSSRVYIFLVKWLLGYRGTDTQCGFKGMKRDVFDQLLPHINQAHLTSNSGWFFDTELLMWAQVKQCKIAELPVEWVEKRNVKRKSRVNLITITWNYIRQIVELRRRILNSAQQTG